MWAPNLGEIFPYIDRRNAARRENYTRISIRCQKLLKIMNLAV